MADTETGHRAIDLASEPDFPLGSVILRPRLSAVSVDGADQRIEPRVMEVLVTLAKAGGRTVSRASLIDICWGGRAVTDDAVHRVIAKARLVGRSTTPPAFEIRTLPKVGFVLSCAATPTEDQSPTPAAGAEARQATDIGTAQAAAGLSADPGGWAGRPAIAVLAAGVLVFTGFTVLLVLSGARRPPEVLSGVVVEIGRVRALSADVDLAVASDRLEDALVRQFQGVAALAGTAGGDGARFRLEASTDRGEDGLAFSARILGRADGVVHWSSPRMPGVEAHAFASKVAAITQCVTDQGPSGALAPPARATPHLFRVCEALVVRRGDAVEAARDLVAAAPDVSASHALLAHAHLDTLEAGRVGSAGRSEALSAATAAAERALALDPQSVIAHVSLARLARARNDFLAAEAQLLSAAAVDSDAVPYVMRRVPFLREVGRVAEALEETRRASRLRGPRLAGWAPTLAFLQAMAGDLSAAEAAIDAYAEIWPADRAGLMFTVAAWWRPIDEAEAIIAALPEPSAGIANRGCILDLLAALRAPAPSARLPDSCAGLGLPWRVRALSRLGDVDGAFAALGSADARDLEPLFFLFYPEMAAVRRDPRFLPFAARLGLFEYWRTSGHWPDFCREPGLPYRCDGAVVLAETAALAQARAEGSPVLTSAPVIGGARAEVLQRRRLRVAFSLPDDGCNAGSAELFTKLGGVVGDGGVYDLSFEPLPDGQFRWRAEGPRQSDCSHHDASYVSSLDPAAGGFTLWGGHFAFDDDGWVYDNWDDAEVHDVGAGTPVFSPARIVGRLVHDEPT